jgi:hypothetical protein
MNPWDDATRAETLGVGAMGLGLLGLALCWWFPFGPLLAACGGASALAARLSGGSRAALLGAVYSGGGVAVGALLLAWDTWGGLIGL